MNTHPLEALQDFDMNLRFFFHVNWKIWLGYHVSKTVATLLKTWFQVKRNRHFIRQSSSFLEPKRKIIQRYSHYYYFYILQGNIHKNKIYLLTNRSIFYNIHQNNNIRTAIDTKLRNDPNAGFSKNNVQKKIARRILNSSSLISYT